MKIEFLKRAENDLVRETDFWHEQSPELVQEFTNEFIKSCKVIYKKPQGYVIVGKKQKHDAIIKNASKRISFIVFTKKNSSYSL